MQCSYWLLCHLQAARHVGYDAVYTPHLRDFADQTGCRPIFRYDAACNVRAIKAPYVLLSDAPGYRAHVQHSSSLPLPVSRMPSIHVKLYNINSPGAPNPGVISGSKFMEIIAPDHFGICGKIVFTNVLEAWVL